MSGVAPTTSGAKTAPRSRLPAPRAGSRMQLPRAVPPALKRPQPGADTADTADSKATETIQNQSKRRKIDAPSVTLGGVKPRVGLAGRATATAARGTGAAATASAARTSRLAKRPLAPNNGLANKKSSAPSSANSSVASCTSSSSLLAAPTSKRPQWDLKGRLADMEQWFASTTERVSSLETQNTALKENVQEKEQVVVSNTQELDALVVQKKAAETEVEQLKKELRSKTEQAEDESRAQQRKLAQIEEERDALEAKRKALVTSVAEKELEVLELRNGLIRSKASAAETEADLQVTKKLLVGSEEKVADLSSLSSRQSARIEAYEEQERAFETERRRLHNVIQELKGNIRVFCRMRPLLPSDNCGDNIGHVDFPTEKALNLLRGGADNLDTTQRGKNAKYEFEFDRVFQPETTQCQVFDEISQLVQSAIDGYNVCVFAYGQTGSGKTFTMEGGPQSEQKGMIPLTIAKIFEDTQNLKSKGWEYTLEASFLEIYNEEIRDLLATEKNLKYEVKMARSSAGSSGGTNTKDVYVTNLHVETVTTPEQISSLLRRAHKNRSVAATNMNERSSRSHSVFQLGIKGHNSFTTETCAGMLHLVDLAGSERLKDSGSEGVRLTETKSINSSLANLGNVIMALAQKDSFIPYRNSKLTHLLQGSLGGNSKTLMFVNISPKEEHFSETLNSLRFATKVNQCHIGSAIKKIK